MPQQRLAFFTISYGREQDWGVYQGATALLYRGRVGWIAIGRSGYSDAEADSVQKTAEWFPLHSADAPLMSQRLLDTLAQRTPWIAESFRGFLGRHAVTPLPVLRRLARLQPRWNSVAQNARIQDPATPWPELAELARITPEVAESVLARPDVRDNPDRVYAVALLPEYRASGVMQYGIRKRFRAFAPTLLADRNTAEPMLLELYYSMEGHSRDTAFMRALCEHPVAQRSAAIMTLFGSDMARERADLAARARARFWAFKLETIDDAKLALIRRVRADRSLPPFAFPHAVALAGVNWRLLSELYGIRGRDSATERSVREALARSQAPLPVLRALAESLPASPHYGIAAGLLSNPAVEKDRRILEIIASLDTARARNLPAWADSLLRLPGVQ